MRARFLLAVLATCVPGTLGVSKAMARDYLPLPPELEQSLAWRADPEMLLQAFRVRPGRGSAVDPQSATAVRQFSGAAVDGRQALCRRKPTAEDVPIANDPTGLEFRPSLAASPRRQNAVVVAYVGSGFPSAPGFRCYVSRSFDRGQRWSEPLLLPTFFPTSSCGAPALAYSPDGRYLYATYQEQRSTTTFLPDETHVRLDNDSDVVFSRSSDDGKTWTPPVRALDGALSSITYSCTPGYPDGCVIDEWIRGSAYERPSLAAGDDACDASSIYVVSTQFPEGGFPTPPTIIMFARSRDRGTSWGSPQALDAGQTGTREVMTHGPRVATGSRGEVLVAWYHSGDDGPQFGRFDIRARRSANRGETWDPIVTAAADELETGSSLGSRAYKRWWTTMFPSLVVDVQRRAHIVYTHDPEPIAATAEEGDIRYVTSSGPPYTDWPAPANVNDDGMGRAQGFASLAARRHGHTTIVEAVWEDTRLAPDSMPGMTPAQAQLSLYDVFHARLVPALGAGWSGNRRISDVSSVQNRASTNDRTALTANHSGLIFAAWSDRRGRTLPTEPGDDVFGSRVAP